MIIDNEARPRERSDTKPSRAGFAVVIRLELIKPGAETCVYQAKSCSPTD